MPRTISVDFETYYSKEFSVVDLGYWKYARDPRCNPYLISVCDGSEAWAGEPKDFNFDSLAGAELISHNAAFDEEIALGARELGLFTVPGLFADGMNDWHCSLNMSAYLWNVRSIVDACRIGLGISVDKGVRDRAKGKTPEDMKSEGWWPDMLKYGRADASNCWHLWNKHSSKWPEFERRLSRQTIDQGRYGLRIDLPALEQGIELLNKVIFQAKLNLPWIARGNKPASPIGIAEECRLNKIPTPPVKAHHPEAAEEWEELYAPQFKFVRALRNIRKAKKMLATLETIRLRLRPDETVAFSLKYAGAHTLRWAGDAGWNLQNMNKEPLLIDSEYSFIFDKKAVRDRCDEFDKEIAGTSACGILPKSQTSFFDIRGLIIARPGMKLAPVDEAQIEPRVLNFLIGNEALLEKVRQGMSIYEAFARTALGWAGGELKTENKKHYALAKADVLGLGYRAGWEKFITVAWTMAGVDILEGDEDFAKAAAVDGQIYRRVRLDEEWVYESAPAGLDVPRAGGEWATKTGRVVSEDTKWETCVFVKQVRKDLRSPTGFREFVGPLPVYGMRSRVTVAEFRTNNPLTVGLWEEFDRQLAASEGHDLVVEGPHGGTMTYGKVRRERRKHKNKETGEEYETTVYTAETGGKRRVLHGGVLTENLVQWVSRMVFAEKMLNLDAALRREDPRQRVLFSVHDEAIPEILDPGAEAKSVQRRIERWMTEDVQWLPGCPLAAECKIVDRYLK